MTNQLSYSRDTKYYLQPTHVFNIPAGWSCPWADNCLTKADRDTGKLIVRPDKNPDGTEKVREDGEDTYVCYAARSERFPSARQARWRNYENARKMVKSGENFNVPKNATHVRIHGSGDFFSQFYFDRWLETIRSHPDVIFWAFTKSIGYWVERIDSIPPNLSLTASTGTKLDHLIEEYGLKTATVYDSIDDVPEDVCIDINDSEAQNPQAPSFALLENTQNKNQGARQDIVEHNKRAMELQGRRQ